LNDEGDEIVFPALIFENLLRSAEPGITKNEARALIADFSMRNKELQKGSEEYIRQLETDIFFNCLLIKYGYAITCYKAQGGEWPHVYFDFCYPARYSEMYYRFCYTGITRAKQILFAINTPPSGLVFIKEKLKGDEPPFEPDDTVPVAINPEEEVVKLIKDSLASATGEFEIKQLQFCVRVVFADAVINIHYNKKGMITRVLSVSGKESNPNLSILKSLEGKGVADTRKKNETENPFLSELYNDICSKLASKGIITEMVEHFNYQERYHFMKDNERCSFNLYYDGKGRVKSKIFHRGSKKLKELIEEQLNG